MGAPVHIDAFFSIRIVPRLWLVRFVDPGRAFASWRARGPPCLVPDSWACARERACPFTSTPCARPLECGLCTSAACCLMLELYVSSNVHLCSLLPYAGMAIFLECGLCTRAACCLVLESIVGFATWCPRACVDLASAGAVVSSITFWGCLVSCLASARRRCVFGLQTSLDSLPLAGFLAPVGSSCMPLGTIVEACELFAVFLPSRGHCRVLQATVRGHHLCIVGPCGDAFAPIWSMRKLPVLPTSCSV